jgi:putative transposase
MTFDSIHDSAHLYFVTATICGWKRLFAEWRYARPVLDSLEYLTSTRSICVYAFVLMPSHLHALIKPISLDISQALQAFGSYTAHQLLSELRHCGRLDLLDFFHIHRRDSRHQHSIWQDIQAKNIYSAGFLRQKLEYIHNNPVRHTEFQSLNRADYPYSSACFYDRGEPAVISIDDIRQIM